MKWAVLVRVPGIFDPQHKRVAELTADVARGFGVTVRSHRGAYLELLTDDLKAAIGLTLLLGRAGMTAVREALV